MRYYFLDYRLEMANIFIQIIITTRFYFFYSVSRRPYGDDVAVRISGGGLVAGEEG